MDWISVKDDPPELNKEIIGYNKLKISDNEYFDDYFFARRKVHCSATICIKIPGRCDQMEQNLLSCKYDCKSIKYSFFTSEKNQEIKTTHWMQRPEPPEVT